MEANDAASSSARAQEMRASLGARREVEALLAEASATREAAVTDADAIIEEAQQVSEQLLRESRTEAERTGADARQRAEGLLARTRAEAEDITRQARAAADAVRARAEAQVEEHRKRVRAELTEQVTREVAEQSRRELARVHERQQGMIGDIEASVRILGVSMEAAVANIAEMLAALDSLRAHTAESLGDSGGPLAATPRHATDTDDGEGAEDPGRSVAAADSEDDDAVPDEDDEDDEDSDPVAGRTARSGHLVDALADLDHGTVAGSDDADDSGDAAENDKIGESGEKGDLPPLTATEAFLRSSHLDHGDPPLPPVDDDDVGVRYARDAMRATARARSRRDEETLGVLPARDATHQSGRNGTAGPDERASSGGDGEGAEASGKPLGWLFRSS